MKDITVILKDSPGTLADLCQVLADAGINIEGISAITYEGECPIHILVEDGAGARKTLEANWMDIIAEKDALVSEIADRPGALEAITRKLANAGVNVEVAYFTTQTKIALVVDDMEMAKSLLP
jgi:hypothetical protein